VAITDYVKKILEGDKRAVARLISDIDDEIPGVREILKEIYPHTGRAYIIGITGAPGVGKSTLVDQMLGHLRKEGKTVGIIAIDPTSPFSGGAILGDRIRMQRHSNDDGIFIRSLATRGHFGGLTQSTRSAIDVLDAMGKDYIIVETVGVGQDEVEIAKNAHTTVIVVIPGLGDDIQAIKAGILEAGDIFVINKSAIDGADRTMSDLRTMIEMGHNKKELSDWLPVVLKTEAIADKGIKELLEEIKKHREHLFKTKVDMNLRRRKGRVREELAEMVKSRLLKKVFSHISEGDEFEEAVESIVQGKKDPYTASDELVLKRLNIFKKT
jgi:LAO/AO transport system kinase